MAIMATMPVSRPLTIEDFEAIRDAAADDRHRYELVDGSLVVTPSPSRVHQRVVSRLLQLLVESNPEPDRLEVLVAPFDAVCSRRHQPLLDRGPGGAPGNGLDAGR